MKTLKLTLPVLLALLFLESCGMYDLRSKELKKDGLQSEQMERGQQLLELAWKKQGMDRLATHKGYSFYGSDTWKGLLGSMGKVWKDKETELEFKFRVNSFDGQVSFLSGSDMGSSSGLQNWQYYDVVEGEVVFSDKDLKQNRRKVFGISAYQYFVELIDRMRRIPIITYLGEGEFRGQTYDRVFCTWHKPEPHMENDQYVLWINQKTGLMDLAQYTIRGTYLKPPGYKMLGGAIEFADFRSVDGIMIPHQQIIYAVNLRKKQKKHLHQLKVRDFSFDDFEVSDLQVDKGMPLGADTKD